MFLIGLILTLFSLLFFGKINELAMDFGFSWTFSKLLPYLLLIISGFLLAFSSLLRWKVLLRVLPMNRALRRVLRLVIVLIPFGVGFVLHPIYEGDFSKNGEVVSTTKNYRAFPKNGLVMLAIPNCPYCLEGLYTMKKMKKRNPDLKLEMLVCTSDASLLTLYKEVSAGEIKIKNTQNPDEYALLADGRFPTFIQVENRKPTYRWSNDQFGAPARDWVEDQK